ncbi:Sec-independent protein translocase subunit TatA [Streptomyces sp. NPDC096354]|uniref:Sec-independent protein translocase subunit TatA n=1 Tax=Streptomyces sp. NPDC096354 TaxID=3366088 RepID=UPI0037F68EA2
MLKNRALEIIIIIAAVVLLLFGAKRVPDTARGLGKSLRIFKSEVSAMKTDAAEPGAAPRAGVQTDAPEVGGQVDDIGRKEIQDLRTGIANDTHETAAPVRAMHTHAQDKPDAPHAGRQAQARSV